MFGVDLPTGVFHGIELVLEADSLDVFRACKAALYRPVGEGELADWAPREGEPGVAEYQAWMRARNSIESTFCGRSCLAIAV